jgi:hypothetical protein
VSTEQLMTIPAPSTNYCPGVFSIDTATGHCDNCEWAWTASYRVVCRPHCQCAHLPAKSEEAG